ncbi:replicative helicase loader/inhibitor [Bacillus seohaeanensis]|uniref:Replicative helicase loader/inhibitor n=1 Tax=Bacillus seohaeanensis TaxID=284580 RepID=A0ABW5RTQ6_9BACI
MIVEELKQLLTKISTAYPGVKFSDAKAELWYEALKDCDCFLVEKKFSSYIQQNFYPPKIADLYVNTDENPAPSILEKINQWEREGEQRIEEKRDKKRRENAPNWISRK